MTSELAGRQVAILAADSVEQAELEKPRDAVATAGAATVDATVAGASVQDYDALILPGGAVNPGNLRQDAAAVSFLRDLVVSGKPVGVICHGPWTLAEAAVVRGRTLRSYPSIPTDIPAFTAAIVRVFAETTSAETTTDRKVDK